MQEILLDGKWKPSADPLGGFCAHAPASKTLLSEREFPISNWSELEALLEAGSRAASQMRQLPVETIACFLEAYANLIEGKKLTLADAASLETGLPSQTRFVEMELPRTVLQLRQAAASARSMDWSLPSIDTASEVRSQHGPLGGPVIVFGPNNFPFAYNGIAGGDFAAAIAAGNPVIAKAHPSHPFTTQLLAELALEAVVQTGLPAGAVQLFYETERELGLQLVSHSLTAAIGFTGSRPAGLALKEAADKAGKPIYLELSSMNPVFVLAGALQERSSMIGENLHRSCTYNSGQFCTKPGLIVVERSSSSPAFIDALGKAFSASEPEALLGPNSVKAIGDTVNHYLNCGARALAGSKEPQRAYYAYEPTLLEISGSRFLETAEQFQKEVFGPVSLVVHADTDEIPAIAEALEGNLTGAIFSSRDESDEETYRALAPILRQKVGRLLNDKVPTGVTVCASMNHGGPFPATGHPGFTAVGFPASIRRFSALHCYDGVREQRLPPALRNRNPHRELKRLIDGVWTNADV